MAGNLGQFFTRHHLYGRGQRTLLGCAITDNHELVKISVVGSNLTVPIFLPRSDIYILRTISDIRKYQALPFYRGIFIVNLPSMSVEVPIVVPLTLTVTPIRVPLLIHHDAGDRRGLCESRYSREAEKNIDRMDLIYI